MTLQQLKYAVAIAASGSINEAAKSLFISQPSLSNAVRELEDEIGITLFRRTNRGVALSSEGAEFLSYARQVIQQSELLEERYLNGKPLKQRFSVSTQHYAFTANAFVELIKEFGGEEYEFTLRETKTHDIIRDVKTLRSELGVIYISDFNEKIIRRLLKENGLGFNELFAIRPHIFVSRDNPLAKNKIILLGDLEDYPCVTFEQGEHNSFYFSEEVLGAIERKRSIKVTDRAALVNLMIGVNAYTIATGVLPSHLHSDEIVAVPLDVNELMRVGIITRKDVIPSRLSEIYTEALRKIANSL